MNTLLICIQNESDAMAALVDVLVQEQVTLTQAPSLPVIEELNEITKHKNSLIAGISQCGQRRKAELNRQGFNLNEAFLDQWLQDQSQKDCWSKLISITKKANELNRVNGLLINKHLIRNQSTLRVLSQNHQNAGMPSLYGSNGQSNSQRSLVRGLVV